MQTGNRKAVPSEAPLRGVTNGHNVGDLHGKSFRPIFSCQEAALIATLKVTRAEKMKGRKFQRLSQLPA